MPVEGLWKTPFRTERPQSFSSLNYADRRAPASRCCQSIGIPPSSTGPPPPQRRPFMVKMRPQMALWTLVGRIPKEISAPVAGHERWVLRSSGAVGLPARARAACSALDRKPLLIWTERRVSASKSWAESKRRSAKARSRPHLSERSQPSRSVTCSCSRKESPSR